MCDSAQPLTTSSPTYAITIALASSASIAGSFRHPFARFVLALNAERGGIA
jgi:hypothetical protein